MFNTPIIRIRSCNNNKLFQRQSKSDLRMLCSDKSYPRKVKRSVVNSCRLKHSRLALTE